MIPNSSNVYDRPVSRPADAYRFESLIGVGVRVQVAIEAWVAGYNKGTRPTGHFHHPTYGLLTFEIVPNMTLSDEALHASARRAMHYLDSLDQPKRKRKTKKGRA